MTPLVITYAELHHLADRAARRCRHVVQACLREEEWHDADVAFFWEILEVFRASQAEAGGGPAKHERQST